MPEETTSKLAQKIGESANPFGGEGFELRIAEALTKDVGRGIARIDPEHINNIGAEVGDIIEIHGKKKTVAKVMPTYAEDRGKEIIQIDGIIRQNAQSSIDEKVKVKKVAHSIAKSITLAPMYRIKTLPRNADTGKYLGRLLEGLPVIKGDRIRATLFGSMPQDLNVVDTIPREIVLIHATTDIKIQKEEAVEKVGIRVCYEDIGGLSREIQRVREMIELPLKHPEVFERLGISPPKGVLLHGPPGTGKTLIARAVANETDAYFAHLSGPEVMAKYYGESEARLRAIFEDAARHAPAILFIDELDAMAPKREEVYGEVEKRVVAQLLSLMDGLDPRGQIVVIGATNIPNILDPALRRGGRFDREIYVGIPDRNGRLEILQIHTRGMPLSKDVDLEKLADFTHGFVGADLETLAKEAAMICLRKVIPKIDFAANYIPYEVLIELEVTMDDFMEALKDVEPSAIREVFVEVPDVRWDDIGGLEKIKKELKETVEWPLKYPELFKHAKTSPPKGILLHGITGTGKTLLAKAVATESGVNFIPVKGPEIMSKWVGESEKGVREVFRKGRQSSPCIIFFDEIDALVPIRGASAGNEHVAERVISQMLTEMDGIEELKGVLVLAATNRLDIIDAALLRPGRFDSLIEVPVPDEESRKKIFEVHTKSKPLSEDVKIETLASLTEYEDLVGADIEAICKKATLLAIREFLEQEEYNKTRDYSRFKIHAKHFDAAIKEVKEAIKKRSEAGEKEKEGKTYV
ncbi:MAG TPA: CDC48 family AAA ATPase [Candidatus Brocadiia bacterium]|nr:CDC48 family AAA ATPase [Candidatus Brocadiales bacterium]